MRVTHAQLVLAARSWLKRQRCWFVVTEFETVGAEIPDALGWNETTTVLIECKTSRADFRADRKKHSRREGMKGLGKFRYYLCVENLIRAEELPPKWGLLYLLPDGKVRHVAGHASAWWYSRDNTWCFEDRNEMCETRILLSALRRLSLSLGVSEFERLVHLPYAKRKGHIASQENQRS